jgi:glucose/arabinose dehydrogenase
MLIRSNNSIGAYATSSAGALIRVERDDQWNTISQKRIYLWDVRVRSIAQWPDGYIYVLTDDTSPQSRPWKNGGSILKLSSW